VAHLAREKLTRLPGPLPVRHVHEDAEHHALDDAQAGTLAPRRDPPDPGTGLDAEIDVERPRDGPGRLESGAYPPEILRMNAPREHRERDPGALGDVLQPMCAAVHHDLAHVDVS
jgi:hypothetical protein